MNLRPYQKQAFEEVRSAFRDHDRICLQMPTGAGKTVLFSDMVKHAARKENQTWILVPRNELLLQASDQLAEIGVNHGIIAAGHNESRAYRTHIVSSNTLIRRWDKIKKPPRFLIIDESHLFYKRQIEIIKRFPDTKILGVTATPERLDGLGLNEIYETLIEGPGMQTLIELGFLSPFRYFCPPLQGLDQIHRKGTDYNPDELAELLTKRQIYGDAIRHYRKYAHNKPALVFCRSVKAAAETAERFSEAGYRFENIDGRMNYKRRKTLIEGLRAGRLHGLTSCELVTYGLDVPRVEAIIMLRPTLSTALYYQMIGRGLRPFMEGGYIKRECIILDHVNNLLEHGHPLAFHAWRFKGTEKRHKRKDSNISINLRLCPELDFMYCDRPSCQNCPHGKTGAQIAQRRADLEQIEGSLKEIKSPVEWKSRPFWERRDYVDKINAEIESYHRKPGPGPVEELIGIADALGRDPMWVYWRLSEGQRLVNVSLLHEIARIKGYKPGWAHFRGEAVRKRLKRTA